MRLKHITKPVLTEFLRYLDKNRVLHPYRVRYSSFRSKKDMLSNLMTYYTVEDLPNYYRFQLKAQYHCLLAPQIFQFSKTHFQFEDDSGAVIDLSHRPSPVKFEVRYGRFLVQI